MRSLSYWGKAHPWTTRSLLLFIHIALVSTSLFLGGMLYIWEVDLPGWSMYWAAILYSAAVLLYPLRGQRTGFFRQTYRRQKTADLGVALGMVLMIAFTFNHSLGLPDPVVAKPLLTTVKGPRTDFPRAEQRVQRKNLRQSFRKFRKTLKKKLREERRAHRRSGKPISPGLKALYTLLTVLLLLGLLYLIAALACAISCNGAEGLAWVVFILGVLGIVVLGVFIFKAIFKKREPLPEEENP